MIASDVRQALRMLLKRPAFAVVAILTLGLGIGANTAIYGSDDDAVGAVVVRLQDELTHGSRDALLLLLGAVALVLLIACANVATTMLARGEERRTELAIRAALGATRVQLVRQLLLESLVLGIGGALAGLLLAAWLVRALGAMSGVALPRQDGIGIDRSVLLFTLALAFLTPLVFGLLPSLQASRPDLRDALAEAGRGSAAPTRASVRGLRGRTRSASGSSTPAWIPSIPSSRSSESRPTFGRRRWFAPAFQRCTCAHIRRPRGRNTQ